MPGLSDGFQYKNLNLKNRIVLPPMQTGKATERGEVTEALKEHYLERAGNIGLMILEHSYISARGKFAENQIGIYDDSLIQG